VWILRPTKPLFSRGRKLSSSTTDSFTARVLKTPGVEFPPVPQAGTHSLSFNAQPQFCAASFPSGLNLGDLTIAAPGIGPRTVQPQVQGSSASYQVTLPTGSIKAGTHRVLANASNPVSPDQAQLAFPIVGPISATTQLPDPITVTTNPAPGTR
jgi:Flp pilus assembly protein TadG